MVNKNGPVSWTDSSDNTTEYKNSKDLFLRLSPGSNVVRILTDAYRYHQHKFQPEGGRKYGYRINCSRTETQSCPLCEKGDEAKKRWLIGVIDRRSNSYKVLDIGPGVYKGIKALAAQDDWGTPNQYDIDVVQSPPGSPPSSYYTVIPKPKKPLTASDLKLAEDNDVADLERRVETPTVERVQTRLAKIAEEIGTKPSSMVDSEESGDNEGPDTFFKDYDMMKVSGTKKNPF